MLKVMLVTTRNYESNAGTLNIAINAGGLEPGNGAIITLFMLDDGCGMPPPPPPKKK